MCRVNSCVKLQRKLLLNNPNTLGNVKPHLQVPKGHVLSRGGQDVRNVSL